MDDPPTSAATTAAAAIRQSMAQFQNWRGSMYVLVLTALVLFVAQLLRRPTLQRDSPKLVLKKESWPVLGTLRFWADRYNFLIESRAASRSGSFSFFFGSHHIVGLSGAEGRKTFFETKALNMSEGYAVLFTATPSVEGSKLGAPGETAATASWFARNVTRLMKKENFVKNLPLLVNNTNAALERMVATTSDPSPSPSGATTGVMDPFDDLYRIVYQLTTRVVGATEIADSPELLAQSLAHFGTIERSTSPARIIFPWLPTLAHMRRMAAGAQLYSMFKRIMDERKRTGTRHDDAMQYLIDSGDSIIEILSFELGILFAGQLNSGINAGWLLCYLAINPEWYARVRDEVDGVISRHRSSPDQTPVDILSKLDIDAWEAEFPMIDLGLRECIRFQLVGTAFRKNISGKDVAIGATGEVVPKGAFALYLLDDVHFDPAVYTDPTRFDPGRFLPDRAEDKKVPQGYLGWGVGRHPCLGMRFAKLEMSIIAALWFALFDYELVDGMTGEKMTETPMTDRGRHSAHKPDFPMRLRYTLRQPRKA